MLAAENVNKTSRDWLAGVASKRSEVRAIGDEPHMGQCAAREALSASAAAVAHQQSSGTSGCGCSPPLLLAVCIQTHQASVLCYPNAFVLDGLLAVAGSARLSLRGVHTVSTAALVSEVQPFCRRAVFERDALPPPPPDEGDSEEEEPAQDWAAGPATGSLGEAEGSGTDDSGAESDDSEGEL